LNGACCATATPADNVDASQNPTIKVLMDVLPVELKFVGGRRSSVNATSLPGCAKAWQGAIFADPAFRFAPACHAADYFLRRSELPLSARKRHRIGLYRETGSRLHRRCRTTPLVDSTK
jgi:hypothetical protein